ncbi:hypothetical protein H2200_007691 [Cladophialophora chaetospira]|uniref:WW domain-containing protein n=1 Tax=Cladophialophora chaetospira TaxID=386627 RepID=A0AA38X6Q8_9EURO|nr:hypothetical protein H2200_007691 [Cladophialophora chaetospira]
MSTLPDRYGLPTNIPENGEPPREEIEPIDTQQCLEVPATTRPSADSGDQIKSRSEPVIGLPVQETNPPDASDAINMGDEASDSTKRPLYVESRDNGTPESIHRKLSAHQSACSENGDPLPPGWERRMTKGKDSRSYYVDHTLHSTSWEHPHVSNGKKGTDEPLPPGWQTWSASSSSRDSMPRTFYFDQESLMRSWQQPLVFPATYNEDDPPMPPGWCAWTTLRNESNTVFYCEEDLDIRTWDIPRSTCTGALLDVAAVAGPSDIAAPAHTGWECWETSNQEKYFIHKPTGLRTWFMPVTDAVRKDLELSQIDIEDFRFPPVWDAENCLHSSKGSRRLFPTAAWRDYADYTRTPNGHPLPRFWERRPTWHSSSGRLEYYVDHINRRSTWIHPPQDDLFSSRDDIYLAAFMVWSRVGLHSRALAEDDYINSASDWIELLDLTRSILTGDLESTDAVFVVDFLIMQEVAQSSLSLDAAKTLTAAQNARMTSIRANPVRWKDSETFRFDVYGDGASRRISPVEVQSLRTNMSSPERLLVVARWWLLQGALSTDETLLPRDIVKGLTNLSRLFDLDSAVFASVLRFFTSHENHEKGAPTAPRYAGHGVLALRLKSSLLLVARGRHFDFTGKTAGIFPLVLLILEKEYRSRGQTSKDGSDFLYILDAHWQAFISSQHEALGESKESDGRKGARKITRRNFPSWSKTPKEMAFFLARLWLEKHWATALFQQVHSSHQSRDYIAWDDLPQAILDLKAGRNNLISWLHAGGFDLTSNPGPEQLHFEQLYKQASEEAATLREVVDLRHAQKSLEATYLSIKESQRGLDEAHVIGRITQLAYVFLPLTFVTGVFGMNIKPFSDGADMWKFWVTTCCILIPSWAFGLWTARAEVKRLVRQTTKNLVLWTVRAEVKRLVRQTTKKVGVDLNAYEMRLHTPSQESYTYYDQ